MRVHVPTTSLHLAHRNESESHSAVSDSFQLHGLCSPWDSPGQNTGVGSLFLHPGDLPDPGIKPMSLTSPALVGRFFTTSAAWEAPTPIQGIGKYDKI